MEATWTDRFTAETWGRLARTPIDEINVWKARSLGTMEKFP
jgi:hypothetical protein